MIGFTLRTDMKNAKKQQHSRYGLERNFSLAIRLAQTTGAFPIELGVFFEDIDVSGRAKPHRQTGTEAVHCTSSALRIHGW